jgi:hypothetical protein
MKPKSLGKISQLPVDLREQVNHRIYNDDPHHEILIWLNTLPEVRKLIVEEYGGKPISKQNFSEWVQNGYRHWRLRQDALAFASNLDEDDEAIQAAFDGSIANKLSRWASLNYAAAAQSLSAKDAEADPEANFRRLHDLCLDIAVLRRGDLSAARIAIEEKRLAIELEHNQKEKEQEFWQWTQRPDVQAKLYPHRDPDKIRRDVDDLISERLLGSRRQLSTSEITEDPSCLI